MEGKYIATASGRLFVQVAGVGEPIWLIHGRDPQFNSWRTFEKNINALSSVGQVYAFDLLGYGGSDKPQPSLDAAGQARALVECMDADKIKRLSIVGLSWGGAIAQLVVAAVPDRIHRLVLVDSAYDGSPQGIAALGRIRCPTLVTWDEEDVVIPVKGARVLGDAIPGAVVRIFNHAERDPDANPENRHWSQMTHSAVWNRAVIEFFAQS